MGKALIRNLKIEDLQKMATLDNLKKALDIIQGVQEAAVSLEENGCTKKQNILKVGTTLTIAFFSKIREGKLPADFEEEDWRDIALHVQEYAVKADETQYSMYVFMLYAAYIEYSLGNMAFGLSDEKKEAVQTLADEIKSKTEMLENEQIGEVDYIDDCLWICLEAMIKLTAGAVDSRIGFEKEKVIEAAAMFAFECGRLTLYSREYELVNGYLENQKILDVELAMQLDEYLKELELQTEKFNVLIDNAFGMDMRQSLRGSVMLAKAAGVGEDELLKSDEEIADYFMQ